MAKELSKKAAQELLTELGERLVERAALDAARQEQIAPITKRYQKACEPIDAEFNPKIAPVDARIKDLKQQLEAYLKAGFDAKTGAAKIGQLVGVPAEGKEMVAAVKVSSQRFLDPEKFCAAIKERTKDFWDCLSVGIAKAEKFIGANRVNALAKTDYKASVVFELREVEELEEAA